MSVCVFFKVPFQYVHVFISEYAFECMLKHRIVHIYLIIHRKDSCKIV